ncbi:unnamed protein product [Prunus armeniaca]
MQPHDEGNEKMQLWRNTFVSSRVKREYPFQDLEEIHLSTPPLQHNNESPPTTEQKANHNN